MPAVRVSETAASISYFQLLSEVERWCGFLRELKIRPGERILVVLPPSPEFITVTFAIMGVQAIIVPVNPLLTHYEFEQISQISDAVALVTTRAIASSYHSSLLSHNSMRTVITIDGPLEGDLGGSDLEFIGYDRASAPRSEVQEPAWNQDVSCHYTYKGLGYPLGVLHNYGAYSTDAVDGFKISKLDEGQLHYAGLPLYPVYGLLVSVIIPLSHSSTIFLGGRETRGSIIEFMAQHKIDVACIVPEIVGQWAFGLKTKGAEWQKILKHRPTIVSGGSHLPAELAHFIGKNLNVNLMQGYGTTETLPCIFNNELSTHPQSIGRPVGETKVRIVGSQGLDLGPGRVGEIWVSGPFNASGFDAKPRETAQFFKQGWFRTGDLGYVDGEGRVCFEGHRQSFAKVMSQMVDLVEVETIAAQHPLVAKAKTVIESDENRQASVTLHVIAKRQGDLSEKTLQRFCRAFLSPHKVPKRINVYRSNRSPLTKQGA